MKTRAHLRFLVTASILTLSAGALAGCAADAASSGEIGDDEGAANAAGDKELTRLGSGSSFALSTEGAYYAFDNGLYRVNMSGAKERLADAPDHAGEIAATENYVALAANSYDPNTLTFYDKKDGFKAKVVVMDSSVIEMLPGPDADHVTVSTMEEGVLVVDADGNKRTAYKAEHMKEVRDMKAGGSPDVVYGVIDTAGEARQLVEINLTANTKRVVLDIEKGSFDYAFDPETKEFLTERSHMSFPNQSMVMLHDFQGKTLKTLEMPLNTFGAMAADHDHFYLAARLGRSPGTGSWKLLTFDKTTLEQGDLGRVEPQVYRMALRGRDLFYSHSKNSTTPLRVRPVP